MQKTSDEDAAREEVSIARYSVYVGATHAEYITYIYHDSWYNPIFKANYAMMEEKSMGKLTPNLPIGQI